MDKDYLYHYTSLQALALILKTKTIKFNSLINMDDMEEKISSEINNGGKYCFVSSWTDDSSESIPMWNLYSKLSGVRIRLPKLPFIKYKWNDPLCPEQEIESYFSLKQLKEYDIFPYIPEHNILYKVKYTEDADKIFPNIKDYVENGYHVDYEKLGKYKRSIWSFQNEWRYILYVRPVKLSDFLKSTSNGKIAYKKNILSGENLSITELFLELEPKSMNDMEILCAPKMTQGDKILLRCLTKEFCSNARIIDSKLQIQ